VLPELKAGHGIVPCHPVDLCQFAAEIIWDETRDDPWVAALDGLRFGSYFDVGEAHFGVEAPEHRGLRATVNILET
jgi:hypothetical protein